MGVIVGLGNKTDMGMDETNLSKVSIVLYVKV
jgi:hypothetical protein